MGSGELKKNISERSSTKKSSKKSVESDVGKKHSSKKRKRDTEEEGRAEEAPTTVEETPKKKKKKKAKNLSSNAETVSDNTDPGRDSSLSAQGRNALSYAYTHHHSPSLWKFHKSRQNWLIRNFWSSTAIPDRYLPAVLKYLSTIQGGAYNNMAKKCQEVLVAVEEDEKEEGDSDKDTETRNKKQVKAPPLTDSDIETRRQRAQKLLDSFKEAGKLVEQ